MDSITTGLETLQLPIYRINHQTHEQVTLRSTHQKNLVQPIISPDNRILNTLNKERARQDRNRSSVVGPNRFCHDDMRGRMIELQSPSNNNLLYTALF